MTMKIVVTNDDETRVAVSTVEDKANATGDYIPSSVAPINPKETKEFWIHSTRRLLIEEKTE